MKRNSIKLFFFFLLLIIFHHSSAQKISPNLVGTNAWFTNPTDEVWELTAQSGVTTIRIGGNAFNDNMPSNEVLLGWVKKIQAMGAEPIIQVSQHQSAEVAASVVRFFNVEKSGEIPPIKFWNIGNEPWLEADRPPTSTVAPLVEAYFKPIAAAMKEVDPTIKIYGPDFAYYIEDAIDDLFGGANDIAGKIPGKDYYYCDGLSWHRYPQDDNINLAYEGIEDFKEAIIKCKQKVDAINLSYNRTGEEALQWGIGEYNAKGGSVVHTWMNGQMFGGVLGLCMKYGATYATSWSMFENGGNRQGTDFSFIDGANMTPRASYRHMEFVAKNFKGEYVDGKSSTNDFIVYGAKDADQTAVMIMHRADDSPKEYTLHLNDTSTAGETYILNVEAGLSTNYSDLIAPQTTQVIIFKGDSITKINYTSDDFDNERAPSYATFKMALALPEKPSNLVATAASHNTIELSWDDNSENEQGFILERESATGFEMLAILSANDTAYTDTELTPETSYSYRIRSYNAIGKSAFSETATAETLETPAAKAFNGPHSIPGVIQIEDFDDNGAGIGYFDTDAENKGGAYRETGVDIEAATEGGFNIGYVEDGEWLTYLIENVTPGTYDLSFRMASNSTSTEAKRIDVFFGDVKVGEITPTNTAGWQNWETKKIEKVEITSADPIQMTLRFSGSGFNLNSVEFTESPLTTGIEDDLINRNIYAYFNGDARAISILAKEKVKKTEVSIMNLIGQTFYKKTHKNLDKTEINTSSWMRGIYLVNVAEDAELYTFKLLIF